jgi:hypothetical protein
MKLVYRIIKHVDYLKMKPMLYDYENVSIRALLMKFININVALKFICHVVINYLCINEL